MRVARVLALAALTALGAAGPATAAMGGAGSPGSTPSQASPTGAPAGTAPSAGALTVTAATVSPRKSFYDGFRYPSLRYSIASSQPQNDIRIDVVDAAGTIIRTFYRNDIAPGVTNTIHWDGSTVDKRPAPNGTYTFRVSAQTGVPARVATAATAPGLSFSFYGYTFPVLGAHDFGGPEGRFGAPRDGHVHQGQDTMAACGTPLVAARGGTVQYAGFEGNAGNYIVIDGKGTGFDFMYAHLAEPALLPTGAPVRTGQPIGVVGETGDATACHLHFEMWEPPGWYQGGAPIDPLPYLKKWDSYS